MLKKQIGELPIPYVYTEGSNEERGYQHGSECAELIKTNINICKDMCCFLRETRWKIILQDVRRFINPIKKYDKGLFEEMEGIAEGAGVSLEEILLLNVRSEVMHPVWMKASITEGCTSFVITPTLTKNGKVFAAQTWDWINLAKECLIVLHSKDLSGHQFITVTEAGIIANIGCNSNKLGVILNYLSVFDINPKGVPYHILLRRALDSTNIVEAQRNLLRSPLAFAINVMLADGDGKSIGYELTAGGVDFYLEKPGYLVHTNHILSDKLMVREVNKHLFPDSETRYRIADAFLHSSEAVQIEDIIRLFSTHVDSEYNICHHLEEDHNYKYGIATLFTVIMELTEMRMYLSLGTPCDSEFYELDLNRIFNGHQEE